MIPTLSLPTHITLKCIYKEELLSEMILKSADFDNAWRLLLFSIAHLNFENSAVQDDATCTLIYEWPEAAQMGIMLMGLCFVKEDILVALVSMQKAVGLNKFHHKCSVFVRCEESYSATFFYFSLVFSHGQASILTASIKDVNETLISVCVNSWHGALLIFKQRETCMYSIFPKQIRLDSK